MKLIKAKISSYRSIVEATLAVDPRVAVLVGANESGKTNLLKALEAFNPQRPLKGKDVCQFSQAYRDNQYPEIQLLFMHFSSEERKGFIDAWVAAASHHQTEDKEEESETDEQEAGSESDEDKDENKSDRPLLGTPKEGPRPDIPSALASYEKITVTRQGNELGDFYFHFEDKELAFPNEEFATAFTRETLKLLPQFLYLDNINLLRGEFEISDLLSDDPGFETERKLMRLGGITDLDILTGDTHRRDIAIYAAQMQITDRLRKTWTQDPSRKFDISVDSDTLRVRISDATGVYDFPEDRSLGSRWFMSFYINFVSRIEGYPDNAILLFDEPGIHIHPRGQRDLLPIFEELGTKYQLIYTTHLPFLINRNFPARIRVIEKKDREGTLVNNKPHQNRWKAIRSAVGLLAADSFIIGDNCLIAEGVTDHIYLAGLSPFLAELGMPHLDLNQVAIIPASSASETIAPARFCQAENIPVVILLDSDNGGNQAAKKLTEDKFIEESQVVRVNEGVSRSDNQLRTFEDLLSSGRFLGAINRFCMERVPGFKTLKIEEISAAQKAEVNQILPRINAIKQLFKERQYGDFDKRSVAEEFVNSLPETSSLKKTEISGLKKEFEPLGKLFSIINKRLEKMAARSNQ